MTEKRRLAEGYQPEGPTPERPRPPQGGTGVARERRTRSECLHKEAEALAARLGVRACLVVALERGGKRPLVHVVGSGHWSDRRFLTLVARGVLSEMKRREHGKAEAEREVRAYFARKAEGRP